MKKKYIYTSLALIGLLLGGVALYYSPKEQTAWLAEDALPEVLLSKHNFDSITLQDFYKMSFQSFYGAEHLAPDTATVLHYLCQEMTELDSVSGIPDLQPIGGYVRVSLYKVKDGSLPLDTLAYGFIESARPIEHAEGEWAVRWTTVEELVLEKYPELADSLLQADLRKAAAMDAAVRHSALYRETYHPHYRIIREDIVERWKKQGLLK